MNILRKARSVKELLAEKDGLHRILAVLRSQYRLPIPQSARSKWKAGIESELVFWDSYFRTKGLQWADTYEIRFDPALPLQPRPADLIPRALTEVHILDVGAGPLTYLGKTLPGKQLRITAVDPLADEYDRILEKYQVRPLVRTKRLDAEGLTAEIQSNTYDLAFARNCIDHAYNPEKAILQMIEVVKKGSYVLLEHRPNEAENERYRGLHQWNFSASDNGDFWISSKSSNVNMTRKYAAICSITCEMVDEGSDGAWLITRIRKN
jgi:SAM-dependent methyltransferase